MADHEAIVAALVAARRSGRADELDRQVEQHLARIDVWGNVSPLTATYRAMVASLRPGAKPESKVDWDRQLAGIRAYLHEAAESEGEGE